MDRQEEDNLFIDLEDVRIHYECLGQGPDLIMIHGNGEDLHLFDEASKELSNDFKVWLLDSRGHGESSSVDTYHYEDMSSDVTAFIRKLGLEGAILFGYSDGGIIGLLTAIRAPGVLSGLICAGANTEPSMLDPEVYRECEEWNREHDDPRMTMMLNEPHITVEELSTIRIPTYVMAGSNDCILREDTDRIARTIGCSELRIVEGHDHSSYIEDHSILSGLIRDAYSFITDNR